MTKTLPLNDVLISFDSETGAIELRSDDPQLVGGKLKLTLSSQSESYRVLLRMLKLNGAVETLDIPDAAHRVEDASQLRVSEDGAPVELELGKGIGGSSVSIDLTQNLLVVGGPGFGKSVLLRNILCYGLTDDRVELRAIDLKQVEFNRYAYRPQDRVALTLEGSLLMLQELQGELSRREELGEAAAELPSIYLLVDELNGFVGSEDTQANSIERDQAEECIEILNDLIRSGKASGIYLFLGTQRLDFIPMLEEFSNLVLMGASSSYHARMLFGRSAGYGAGYLNGRGRGILSVQGGEHTIFQGNLIPYGLYADPVRSSYES